MSLFKAFLYQVILFLVMIAVSSFKSLQRGDEDLSGTFPSHWYTDPPWFITFLIMVWFIVLTYVRAVLDWPLLGVWDELFSYLS